MTTPEQLTTEQQAITTQLDLLAEKLAFQDYPGYPAFADRLVTKMSELAIIGSGALEIPDGPWTVNTHSNRPDTETAPTELEQELFRAQGLQLDQLGRPLHPWLKGMIENPAIGIVTGKGAYWNWGPNPTVDSVVIRGDDVLIITREDTGNKALPGGFEDEDEAPEIGAPREVEEESGILIPELVVPTQVYQGPVVDIRVTANSWPVTTAFLFELDPNDKQIPVGADDAADANFEPIHDVLHGPNGLFGSHRFLLQLALLARQRRS